jgi:hypothetical protein
MKEMYNRKSDRPKKNVNCSIYLETIKSLKVYSIETERFFSDVVNEAIEEYLTSRGKPIRHLPDRAGPPDYLER